jgi:hypothetical protein
VNSLSEAADRVGISSLFMDCKSKGLFVWFIIEVVFGFKLWLKFSNFSERRLNNDFSSLRKDSYIILS